MLDEIDELGRVVGEGFTAAVRYDLEWRRSSPHTGLPTKETPILTIRGLHRPYPPRLTLHMTGKRKLDFDFSGPECKVLGVPYIDDLT